LRQFLRINLFNTQSFLFHFVPAEPSSRMIPISDNLFLILSAVSKSRLFLARARS